LWFLTKVERCKTAGSWEILEQKKVLVGILHVDNVTLAWSFGLRNLRVPGQFVGMSGMPFDHARNQVVALALREGFQYVGFLDSDVVPPSDAFLRLLNLRQPIVSGMYCRRSPPHGVPVALKGGQWITQLPMPGQNPVIEVDVVGAGLLLVHRSVFENMPASRQGKPWYDWRVDSPELFPPGEAMSEDFTWCLNARRAGYKVLLDTSIRARHVGYSQVDFGSMLPLETHPFT